MIQKTIITVVIIKLVVVMYNLDYTFNHSGCSCKEHRLEYDDCDCDDDHVDDDGGNIDLNSDDHQD